MAAKRDTKSLRGHPGGMIQISPDLSETCGKAFLSKFRSGGNNGLVRANIMFMGVLI
jgi:hypothetical protein